MCVKKKNNVQENWERPPHCWYSFCVHQQQIKWTCDIKIGDIYNYKAIQLYRPDSPFINPLQIRWATSGVCWISLRGHIWHTGLPNHDLPKDRPAPSRNRAQLRCADAHFGGYCSVLLFFAAFHVAVGVS